QSILRGARCRERPTHPEPATRPAIAPAAGGSLPGAGRPRRSSGHPQSPSSPRSSDLGCTFSGPNPYTSPFNVFGPLTFCLIFGVQSIFSVVIPPMSDCSGYGGSAKKGETGVT